MYELSDLFERSGKDGVEFYEDITTRSSETFERSNNAFALQGLNISKAYLSRDIDLWLRLRITQGVELDAGVPFQIPDFYARLQVVPPASRLGPTGDIGAFGSDSESCSSRTCRYKEVMPIVVSQGLKSIEHTTQIAIFDRIGLNVILEDFARRLSYPAAYSVFDQSVEMFGGACDRKAVCVRGRLPVFLNQSNVELVKSRNEIERCIPNDQRPHSRHGDIKRCIHELLPRFTIEISEHSVFIGCPEEFVHLFMQVVDVMLGPFDLEKRPFKLPCDLSQSSPPP